MIIWPILASKSFINEERIGVKFRLKNRKYFTKYMSLDQHCALAYHEPHIDNHSYVNAASVLQWLKKTYCCGILFVQIFA